MDILTVDVDWGMVTACGWTRSFVLVGEFAVFTEGDFIFGYFNDTTTLGAGALIDLYGWLGQLALFDYFHVIMIPTFQKKSSLYYRFRFCY